MPSATRWLSLVVALLALNASLTFQNVWPTLAIRFPAPPEISPELALAVLALVAWGAWWCSAPGRTAPARESASRALATGLAALSVPFLVARYAEVTAPALYGRPVNLYWDTRHVGNVVRMLVEVAGTGLALAVAAGALLAAAIAFVAFRAAWARIGAAVANRTERRVLGVVSGVVCAGWFAALAGAPVALAGIRYSIPVTQTYAEQLRLIASAAFAPDSVDALARDANHPAEADRLAPAAFEALGGDDVLLVFLESYGAVTYTRPEFAARLAEPRNALAAAIEATGRRAVSATVTAPTFGGNSWLSHLTLLSGLEITAPDAYARTMQIERPTLVQEFAVAGYRTIALMPGLRQAWPEGAFYRFDAIVGADALDYRGPEFGWWRIPDQYALAALEREPRDGRPRFVFFPTISSHAPFRPTPPYQPDWERLAGDRPFGAEAQAALEVAPDWTDLGPAYGDTIAYAHEWLAGWLRRNAAANATVVVLGDHQPPAAVSGPGADWTVPVHVFTRRESVIGRLLAAGFVAGLQPPTQPLMRMHALRPVLRSAFTGTRQDGEPTTPVSVAARIAGHDIDAAGVHVAGSAREAHVPQLAP
jgi:hypothetical protein